VLEILLRLHAHFFLECGGEVFRVLETNPVGNVADAQAWILPGQSAGGFQPDVADECGYIHSRQCAELVVQGAGTGSHICGKGVAVVVGIVKVFVNAVCGTL